MKMTAIKTISVGKDGKSTVYGPGDDFEVSAEVGERLIELKKAGRQGTVEIAKPGEPEVIPAEPAAKPDAKKK